MENSPGQNLHSDTKATWFPLASLSHENVTEMAYLKERIIKLEEIIRHKDKFIREIGESKDEDAHEFDLQKARLLEEIEQLNAKVTKRMNEIELVHADLAAERTRSKKLEAELHELEEKLEAERNRVQHRSFTESNSFGEGAEKALQAKLIEVEKDLRLCDDENAELHERIEQMEALYAETVRELDNFREMNASLRETIAVSKEHTLELESELHALRVNPEMAKQGNSLFGEVVEGREKQEQEMAQLFRDKERFRMQYDKALKMLHENTTKAEQNFFRRDALSGPTLAVFKKMKQKLKYTQHENERMKERVAGLESDLLNIETNQLTGHGGEARIRNQVMQDDLRSKKRLEMQINQLQAENHDLLDKIAAESSRASAVPSLEHRIEMLQKIIAQLEADRHFDDNATKS